MRLGLIALGWLAFGCNVLGGLDDLRFDQGAAVSSSASGAGAGAGAGAGGSGNAGAGGTAGEGGCEANLMTDTENCGACGFDCLGANCVDGLCDAGTVIAAGESYPNDVETRDGYVYWINSDTGVVRRCPGGGCGARGPETLGVSGPESYYLAVDDESVFWNNNAQGEIWKCPLEGCGGSGDPFFDSVSSPTEVGVDDNDVCWHSNSGALTCVPKVGGVQPITMITGEGDHGDIQPRGTQLFWTSRTLNYVRRCDKNDCIGTVLTLEDSLPGVVAFDVNDDFVFAGTNNGSNDVIVRMAHDGSGFAQLTTEQAGILGIDEADGYVYWANVQGTTVRRVPVGLGAVDTIADGLSNPRDVAVMGDYAYVTVPGDETVWRFPLPR